MIAVDKGLMTVGVQELTPLLERRYNCQQLFVVGWIVHLFHLVIS